MRLLPWAARPLAATLVLLAPLPLAAGQTLTAQAPQAQSPRISAAQTQVTLEPTGPVKRLTLNEAVQLALEQNINIQVERMNSQIQGENVDLALAVFVPELTSDLRYNSTDSPPDSFFSGAEDTLETSFLTGTAGVQQQLPWWGASYFLGWDATRSTTNNIYSNFNPRLNSNLSVSYLQPLLRNFKTDSARTQLVVSKRNRDISDIDLRTIVVQTVRNVKNAYWELKYAIANLDVQRQSLELAQQTLKDNRTRVEVGTMAPIDIVEAEAEVARNEEAVIIAEASIKQAEDNLRTIIFDPASAGFWQMVLEPIDAPEMDPRTVDLDEAVRNALEQRTDVRRAKESLDNVDSNLEFYRNQTLPQLNLQVDYGATGLGGTQFVRGGEGFPPPIIGEASRSFWDVQGDVFTASFPGWTIGAYFAYPLGKGSADAIYARTKLEQNQALLQLKNLELQVGTEVRDVARNLNTNTKRVDATRASRVLSERRLEAEQKKFGVGMSTSFLVFQAQRDLSTARANELRAILDLNQSLADFEAVQEAALSGRGITISSGGGALATSAGATIATGLRQR